ncbi:MAG TPA: glycosyltransferase family 9 protein [Candidatus Limnocylindrales bacterium]|nr:glycosyltransferase family 9 protein [Candidatus Limnocylindrales bacterium]
MTGAGAAEYVVPPRAARVAPWIGLKRILAVRLDAAGDVVMTTPALRALRAIRPERLTLLTSASGAAVAELLPEIDDVIVYDAPWMKATPGVVDPGRDAAFIERLRAERFDAAAIFTVHSQSPLPAAMMAYLADIPRRLAHCHENPYELLTDWVPDPETDQPLRHEVRRQLDLLAHVGIETSDEHLSLHVPDVASRAIRERLAYLGIGPRDPWLLVHPGATAPSRRYPPDRLAEVLRRLGVRTDWPIVLTGSRSERRLVEDVRAGADGLGISLAGQLTTAELAAVVAVAPMLLTNNSLPAHIAAAVGTPVVDLYALTNVQHTPWAVPNRVLSVDVPCKGCRRSVCPLGHNRCLHGVEPTDIVDAILELARETGMSERRTARTTTRGGVPVLAR